MTEGEFKFWQMIFDSENGRKNAERHFRNGWIVWIVHVLFHPTKKTN